MGVMSIKRKRILYIFLVFVVIILGLASRKYGSFIPGFLKGNAGDTLWSIMVFFIFRTIFYNKKTKLIFIYTIAFSYAIEISQLYHAPWIDAIRATTLGGLVLGYVFSFNDLICYAVGALIADIFDKIIQSRIKEPQ